ncbi:FERM domain-containing protein 8 isoform X1 [Sphaerodactylus townsendi]|uniref:FERM domain-containing protein 8 isoform X1 n=1 Tax=Sphaerodactylus townsendi TaxID=933632 RepID=UPI00202681CD|nr:FERM domain-containing protein 8 isoform X1 [Sphaerodactylus townsendi]XP_048372716.1 FERM domain-containing protein 8 isoform X1 [Sphaerodactylus townsendi]XP_048372717.1 FERM domain-containing protein 8 isoform X1 [Sphaerodactylus townsendi]XP_048372718.1 FERM domain-containing protein 8 isoform X1 [Sphaerodactylus townsendi]
MEGDRLPVPPSLEEHSRRSSISSISPRTLDVVVYLINDTEVRLTVDNLPSATVLELHRLVRDALRLPDCALEVFSLWLISPLLELQLKPKHQPYKVCRQWHDLLFRFTSCSEDEICEDEPSLQLRRNVFFPKRKELQIQDEAVLQLLYEEAKYNILEGRYPCDPADCEMLGALVCRLSLGPYDPEQHTACFLKEKLDLFLPSHLCRRGHGLFSALWKRGTRPPAYEQGLLHAYQTVLEDGACEENAALHRHYCAYLQKCHELPYYGCAFFSGEIDKPAQGFLHRGGRKAVSIVISLEGIYIIDSKEKLSVSVSPGQHVLLGLHFQELSWDHTFPSEEEHILWLEFDGENEGTAVNKLLKVYSKQAELMSGLIEYCIELNAAAEGAAQDLAGSPAPPSEPQSLPTHRQPPKLQRQNSVLCSRIQHLSTIDYIDNGKEIRRVKPRRTASFFGRQLSTAPTSYSAVRGAENLEHG